MKCHSYKYLGVILDQALKYDKFVKQKLKTVAFRNYQLARLNAYIDNLTALLLYKTFILPILEYGDIYVYGATDGELADIQKHKIEV